VRPVYVPHYIFERYTAIMLPVDADKHPLALVYSPSGWKQWLYSSVTSE